MQTKKIYDITKNIWVYARTSGLINSKDSIPNQISEAVEYAKDRDWTIQGIIQDEAKTGTNTCREGYQKLVSLIKRNKVDIVLVTFFDRLSRQTEVLLNLLLSMKEEGIECISICEEKILSQMSDFEIANIAIYAENENIARTNRISKAKGINLSKGQYLHRPSFGFIRDQETRKLKINPKEAALVKEIFQLFLNGKGLSEIAKYLNDIRAFERKWSTKLVENVLTDKKHTGGMYRKVIGEDKEIQYELLSSVRHDPIIEEETFNKVAEAITKEIKNKRAYSKHQHIFKDVIYCPVCSTNMKANKLYYFCSTQDCSFSSIRNQHGYAPRSHHLQ